MEPNILLKANNKTSYFGWWSRNTGPPLPLAGYPIDRCNKGKNKQLQGIGLLTNANI